MKALDVKHIYPYIILFFGAFAFLLLCSPLSPLSRIISTGDTSVYVYCAQQILEGKIMYKDIFDHKGPLLYAINIFGLIIGRGNTIGIWFFQIVSLLTSLFFIYKSIRLFYDRSIALIASLSSLFLFMMALSGGNLPDEYAVCFISIAMYYFFKLFGRDSIKKKYYLIIAICFGCVLLLKPNLTIMWVVGWFLHLIFLIKDKNVNALKTFFLFSFLGVIIILIPFLLYFYITDSFADFKFCYWDFNQAYSDPSIKNMFIRLTQRAYLYPIYRYCNAHIFLFSFLIIAVVNFKYFRNKKLIAFIALTLILSIIVISLGQYLLVFYYLLLVPMLSFTFAMIYHFVQKNISYHSTLICCTLFLLINSLSLSVVYTLTKGNLTPNLSRQNIIPYVKKVTNPQDEIAIFGNSCWVYSLSERQSASKYIYTHPIIFTNKYGEQIFNKYYIDIETKKPKLIIVSDKASINNYSQLLSFIHSNYSQCENFDSGNIECWIRK